MNDENKKIIGYNPKTGEPIYDLINNNQNLNLVNPVEEQDQSVVNENIVQSQGYGQVNNIQSQVGPNMYQQSAFPQQQTQVINPNYQNYNSNNFGQTVSSNNKNKKKIIIFSSLGLLFILTFVITIFLFNDKSTSRTLMIYMTGSDLESGNGLATVDLDSIDYSKIDTKNTNVVLIAGGSSKWNNNYINSRETSIYELTSNGFEKVKQQSKLNMGNEKTLNTFLNYVYENYKTDEYDLIFWNHGGAILGSEFDENFDSDNLTLEEMDNAFKNSSFKNNNKLELIIFRTCLNGTIEIASTLDKYANYLVASEEVTVGSSNTSVLNFINDINHKDTAVDIGKKYVNSYKKQVGDIKKLNSYFGGDSSIYSTYSVVDLSKINTLAKDLNSFFSSIDVSSNYSKIAKARSNLFQYAEGSDEYDMVDLYSLIDELSYLSSSKANKLKKTLESTIVYNWATNSKSRGMSIYFPYKGGIQYQNYFLNLYDTFDSLSSYKNFISNFSKIQHSSSRSYSFTNNKTDIITSDKESNFTLELTDNQIDGFAKANYMVFKDKGDGYYSLVYRGNEVSLDGNTLKASIEGRQLQAYSNKENFKYILPLVESSSDEDYIKYTAYAVLADYSSNEIYEWKVDNAAISLYYNKNTKDIGISNVVLNSKDLPGSVSANLKDYTNIEFGTSSYKITDENGNYIEDWESNGIFEGAEFNPDELEFELANFDKTENYYCVFRIYDVDNNYYYSNLIKMK